MMSGTGRKKNNAQEIHAVRIQRFYFDLKNSLNFFDDFFDDFLKSHERDFRRRQKT